MLLSRYILFNLIAGLFCISSYQTWGMFYVDDRPSDQKVSAEASNSGKTNILTSLIVYNREKFMRCTAGIPMSRGHLALRINPV